MPNPLSFLTRNLWYFLFAMILANIAGQMLYTMLPIYLTELNASVAQVGLVFTLASLVPLVEQMFDLHKKLSAARAPQEKERLERQIKATDSVIDALVYALYVLTDGEIRIVEGQV